MDPTAFAWVALVAGLIALLLVDLLVLHRDTHAVSVRDAAWSTAGFVAVAGGFGIALSSSRAATRGPSSSRAICSSSRCRSTTCSCGR